MDYFFLCANILFPRFVFTVIFVKGGWIRFPAFVFKRNFQSMRNNSPKKTNKSRPVFSSSRPTVCLLRNVGVHFTILWRPRQVFSFYKSFDTLFDYHRAWEETGPELLSHLRTHSHETVREMPSFQQGLEPVKSFQSWSVEKFLGFVPLPPTRCAASSFWTS